MANILITGASGYLGGDLFDYLQQFKLPQHGTIYALVRKQEQAEQIEKLYNATPLFLDFSQGEEDASITRALLERKISIVFSLIDAFNAHTQLQLLKGLSAVGKKHNLQTHFLHTSGAKLFSGFAGHPTDRVLSDADDELFTLQKTSKPQLSPIQTALNTNNRVIEEGEALGIKTYIFIPCIVYGESKGFGNKISIQTKAVVQVARAIGKVHKPDNLNGTWPVCTVRDNSKLYAQMLAKIVSKEDIPYDRNGYYLASPGSVAWSDIYLGIAKGLFKRGVIQSEEVEEVSQESLVSSAKALECPVEFVSFQTGGKCTLQADNGSKIGWKPDFAAEHILEALDNEVELSLRYT